MILVWNMDIGGVQKRVRDILFYLRDYYPDLRVELLIKRAYPTFLLHQVSKLSNVNIRYFSRSRKKIWLPSFFWLMQQYFSIRPNIVLAFLDRLSIQMALIKKIFFWRQVRLVLNEGIYTSTFLKMYENSFWRLLVRLFYPLADRIIVPTQTCRTDLYTNFRVPKEKILVIPHWTLLVPRKLQKKIYDFIYIGRLEKEKNIFWLLKLIRFLKKTRPSVSLCVLGTGSLQSLFLERVRYLRLTKNVFYFGFVGDVEKYLGKSKILLLPSLNEGMPNCVLEAGVYHVSSVVYDFPGAAEVVLHGKTGFIADDKASFFAHAHKLVQNSRLRTRMGLAASAMVLESFSRNNLERFVEVLIF